MMDIRYIDSTDDRKSISRVYENSWKTAYKGIIPADYLNSIPEGPMIIPGAGGDPEDTG